jgi:hypothetical protein
VNEDWFGRLVLVLRTHEYENGDSEIWETIAAGSS